MATTGDLIWPPPGTFSWPWTRCCLDDDLVDPVQAALYRLRRALPAARGTMSFQRLEVDADLATLIPSFRKSCLVLVRNGSLGLARRSHAGTLTGPSLVGGMASWSTMKRRTPAANRHWAVANYTPGGSRREPPTGAGPRRHADAVLSRGEVAT